MVAGAVAVLVAASPAFAQGQGRRGFGQQATPLVVLGIPAVQEKLALTAEQKTKLGELRNSMQEKMRELFQAGGANQDAIRELNQQMEKDAEAILNDTQKTNFKPIMQTARDLSGLGRLGLGLLGVTGLSDTQFADLKKLASETAEKQRAIMQEAQGGDRQAAFQRIRELDEATGATVRQKLNEAQAKQFDDTLRSLPGPRRRQNN
jgi:hypothetical protein